MGGIFEKFADSDGRYYQTIRDACGLCIIIARQRLAAVGLAVSVFAIWRESSHGAGKRFRSACARLERIAFVPTRRLTILPHRSNSISASAAHPAGFTCKIASCLAERRAAFELVYRAYLQAGLIEPNSHQMRLTEYHLLPSTDIFLACDGERPIASLSLLWDDALGLPCEALFPLEAERRRRRGRKLAEASSLALDATNLPRKQVLLGLMRLLAQVASGRGCDEIMASVHPRYASFYQRFLGFEAFGSTVPHRQLRSRPAQGLALSFARIERLRPPAYDFFFSSPIPAPLLASQPISSAEQAFFQHAAQSDRLSRVAGVDGSILRRAA